MKDRPTLRKHAALVDRTAERLGSDLEAAVLDCLGGEQP
ncbi:MAG: DUF6455 family protein [Pseudopelagicola sp.]|nr:DUF6455 family protein [Pseudopelagicola sp.]